MNLRTSILSAAAAAALAGCAATPPVDDPDLYAAGWRRGIVVALGTGEPLITPDTGLCVGAHRWQPGEAAAAVRFTSGNRFHRSRVTTIVPTPMVVQPDESLYLNLNQCRLALALPAAAEER